MLDECAEPSVRQISAIDLSKGHHAGGEAIYRKLSGLLHGRTWSVLPGFEMAPVDGGHMITWRGYPAALHEELSLAVVGAGERAMGAVASYFTSPTH